MFEPEVGEKVYVSPEITSTGTFVAVKSVTQTAPEGFVISAKVSGYEF
ncbi:MAG: hypothetical protein QMC36_07810 [Patescibacteria group bacterium]